MSEFEHLVQNNYNHHIDQTTINSCLRNLNFLFIREKKDGKMLSVNEIYETNVVELKGQAITFTSDFNQLLDTTTFAEYLLDNVNYAIQTYNKQFDPTKFYGGFVLYRKYSRKDVFRILNWEENPVAQNVGGYIISTDKTNCPIFVNYHKEEHISSTTKYEDHFIDNSVFEWMSKSNRTLNSSDVQAITGIETLRKPLFIKKTNDEGTEFYYMGELSLPTAYEQVTMSNDKGKDVPVVKMQFALSPSVEENLYEYITESKI